MKRAKQSSEVSRKTTNQVEGTALAVTEKGDVANNSPQGQRAGSSKDGAGYRRRGGVVSNKALFSRLLEQTGTTETTQ